MIDIQIFFLNPDAGTCCDAAKQYDFGPNQRISFGLVRHANVSPLPHVAYRSLTNAEYHESTVGVLQEFLTHVNVWESVAVDEDRWAYILKTGTQPAGLTHLVSMEMPEDADIVFFDTTLKPAININCIDPVTRIVPISDFFYPVSIEDSRSGSVNEYLISSKGAKKLLEAVITEGFSDCVDRRILEMCLTICSAEEITVENGLFSSLYKEQRMGSSYRLQGYVTAKSILPAQDQKKQFGYEKESTAKKNSNIHSSIDPKHSGHINMNQHWARVVMTQKTRGIVASLTVSEMDALEISGDYWRWGWDWRSFKSASFPNFNICYDTLNDEKFDIIFAEQVFEHLPYPYRAARNVFRMLRPGGFFLLTLPFLIKIHPMPYDCSRWTPQGLRFFLQECGFDQSSIVVDSWGNRECINANFESWADYIPGSHSLENEPDFPIVVWALARKER